MRTYCIIFALAVWALCCYCSEPIYDQKEARRQKFERHQRDKQKRWRDDALELRENGRTPSPNQLRKSREANLRSSQDFAKE